MRPVTRKKDMLPMFRETFVGGTEEKNTYVSRETCLPC